MCGIAGIFDLNSKLNPVDKQDLVIRMTSCLEHRGPDGWGYYTSPLCNLGHTRLSIIDIAGGMQPMVTDRFAISYNGEIYNYLELKKELESLGVQFTSTSDTEVLIRAYEQYGQGAIKRFNGQFAFLLWDKKKHQLIAGRDRFGIRPLYVLNFKGVIYFSSEMKSFDRIPDFSRNYEPAFLHEHGLLWNTLCDATVWKGIRSVAPGTYEVFGPNENIKVERYYSLGESLASQHSPSSLADAEERLRALLEQSVSFRLRSDVPVGVYISGGIDSSVIAALTARIQRERFKTFSITFSDTDYDESTFQQQMVGRIGSDHTAIRIDYQTVRDTFMDTIYHCERPVFRTAPIPLYLLSQAVNESNIKVILTGEAADEILFGYDTFKELKLIRFWQRQPASALRPLLIRKLYPHLKHYAEPRQYGLLKMYYENFLGSCDNELAGCAIRVGNNAVISHTLNKDFGIRFDREHILNRLRNMLPTEYKHFSPMQRNQFIEMRSLLSGYLLSSQGDRMSLAHGVEGRYPFLDHTVIEEIFAWPDKFKLFGFEQKHVLRRAFNNLVPESIIQRPKLPYQAPDLKSFIDSRGIKEPAAEFLSERKIKDYGVFDPKFVNRFLRKFSQNTRDHIGYRDNMVLIFMLSAQVALYWAKNPKDTKLSKNNLQVEISE